MSKLEVNFTLSGIHSRSENLVRTSRDYDRGRVDENALNAAFASDADQLIRLEDELGFSSFSDGQLRWQDFIRPFSESVSGLYSGADLSRWFDTNTFYKKPTVREELKTDGSFLKRSIYSTNNQERKKISLPGPYTLASLVDNEFYSTHEELVHAFSKVLKQVIQKLSEEGFVSIQINEPSLVYRYGKSALTSTGDLRTFTASFRDNLSKSNAEITLHTYFGDSSQVLKELLKLEGISTLGVDFTQTSLEGLSELDFDGKALGCGCVDARSSFIESPEWIADFSKQAARKLNCKSVTILPSADLKYLPRTYADQKLKAIASAANMVRRDN